MKVELELRKLLEQKGFKLKPNSSFIWSYEHPMHKEYKVINYLKHKGDPYIWFNNLSTYMKSEVKKIYGIKYKSYSENDREKFYKNTLSKFSFYEKIKNNIEFVLKEHGDYVGISENVGIEVLTSILNSIISNHENLQPHLLTDTREYIPTKLEIAEEYLPDWSYVKSVIDQIPHEAPTVKEILNAIETKARDEQKTLKKNWREITRRNIPLWLVAYQR